jgi:hypothetical protein
MSRRALALLVRERRQEVDEARAAVTEAVAALTAAEAALSEHVAAFAPEMGLALGMPDGPRLAAAYAAGFTLRKAALAQRQAACTQALWACEAELRERATALKTMEKAEARLAEAEAAALAKGQQLRLDEAAIVRHSAAMRSELRG